MELPTSCGRLKPLFSSDMEKMLKEYCLEVNDRFYGLTLRDVRALAYDLAEKNNLECPFDKETRLAGKDWAYSFIRRNGLSLRQPEPTSIARAIGFNPVQTKIFYDLLKDIYQRLNIVPAQIFNWNISL